MNAVHGVEPRAKPVRIISFNKSETTNWGVPWHQDRVIAVKQQHDIHGFGNWTRKSGIWHCEPPQESLDRMLFVRLHLDDTDATNGAMRVAVGSHRTGIILSAESEAAANRFPLEICDAKRGDIMILKMLTLHSSKPSKVTTQRRVLRIDFASFDLPEPLKWAW
ncbi:MAG: phytanoyl-CoA dioxygenase family protein [Marinosulfonomonas sp.]|nr:phytanoyl-CoA dioxygenase family protein [Marinosulfonomonas sp.]